MNGLDKISKAHAVQFAPAIQVSKEKFEAELLKAAEDNKKDATVSTERTDKDSV